ncbi:hypothetical protein ABEX25_05225 [Paenibacillus thiaminolyticus]|uniref:hypothetical protein n=1 Tax=Paenibacillus thiaminolyticus TaxID=49283 RepID=UPI003D298BC8
MNAEQGRDEFRSLMIRLLKHTPHEKLLTEGVKPVRRPYVYLTESADLPADVGKRQGEGVIVEWRRQGPDRRA